MKGNLSLAALLSIAFVAQSFAMETTSYLAGLQSFGQNAFNTVRNADYRGMAASAGNKLSELRDSVANADYRGMVTTAADKATAAGYAAVDAVKNYPVMAASGVVGTIAATNAIRTWRNTPGTNVQRTRAVVRNPYVGFPAVLGAVAAGLNYTGNDVKAIDAITPYLPETETVVSWAKSARDTVVHYPYHAAVAASPIAGYVLYKAYNATLGQEFRSAAIQAVPVAAPLVVDGKARMQELNLNGLTNQQCEEMATRIDTYANSENLLDLIIKYKLFVTAPMPPAAERIAVATIARNEAYAALDNNKGKENTEAYEGIKSELSKLAQVLRNEPTRRAQEAQELGIAVSAGAVQTRPTSLWTHIANTFGS